MRRWPTLKAWHFGENIMLIHSVAPRKNFFEYRKSPIGRHWNIGRLRLIIFTSR